MRAPTAWKRAGSFRKSLISSSSSTASSAPATSAKVTFGLSFETSFAFDLPNCMTRLPPPCMLESRNQKITPMSRNGRRMLSRLVNQLGCGTSSSNLAVVGCVDRVDDLGAARGHVVELHLRALVGSVDLERLVQREVDPLVAVDDLHGLDGAAVQKLEALLGGDLLESGRRQQVEAGSRTTRAAMMQTNGPRKKRLKSMMLRARARILP